MLISLSRIFSHNFIFIDANKTGGSTFLDLVMSITTECGVLAAEVKCADDSCGSAPEVTNVYGTAGVPLYIYLGKT